MGAKASRLLRHFDPINRVRCLPTGVGSCHRCHHFHPPVLKYRREMNQDRRAAAVFSWTLHA